MISKYRGNRQAISALVRETEVHRDLYLDQELFELEMEHLFANTWIYVGHDSQVPKVGDYYATTIGAQPVIMVRDTSDSVKVLYNRCPHKGTRLTGDTCGNVGRFFRCPYHAWTFRLDGSLAGMPLKSGYDNTGFAESHGARGMTAVRHVHNYRGFVFGKLSDVGPGFDEFFGEALSSIDNMVDRSPVGKFEVAGGVLRYRHDCNWKMLVDNLTDTCHPMIAHQSSAGTTVKVWKSAPDGTQKPMAVEIYGPFMSSYEFFDKMGIKVFPNGHGYTGVPLDPFRLFGDPGLLRQDGRRLWGEPRQGDPRREPAQHRLFPQPDDEGSDPAFPPLQTARRQQDACGITGPSASSAHPTCCSSAPWCITG